MRAASHGKAGVTVNPAEADKNQQNTLPHLRLMEWVWSYFVDTDLFQGTSNARTHSQSTKAGTVHAQPSKQARGASHWQHQEERLSKMQKISDQQTSGASGSSHEPGGSSPVSRSGQWLCISPREFCTNLTFCVGILPSQTSLPV